MEITGAYMICAILKEKNFSVHCCFDPFDVCSSFDTAAMEFPIRNFISTHLISLWKT